MAALAKMSNVVPSSRGVRASGELALELEGELGVVGADNGLLVGQLAPLDLTAFASFLTQPLDHLVHAGFGALDSAHDCACLAVLDPPSDAQSVGEVLCVLGKVTSLHLPEHLEVRGGHLHRRRRSTTAALRETKRKSRGRQRRQTRPADDGALLTVRRGGAHGRTRPRRPQLQLGGLLHLIHLHY